MRSTMTFVIFSDLVCHFICPWLTLSIMNSTEKKEIKIIVSSWWSVMVFQVLKFDHIKKRSIKMLYWTGQNCRLEIDKIFNELIYKHDFF